MREALIMISAFAIASFIILVIESEVQPEYYEYKGKLRINQLYAELESVEPRAMIYARSQVDSFLASVNGTACELDPVIDPNMFSEAINEDLGYKGFLSSIDLKFSVFETEGGGASSEYFGSYCRKGGIGVRVKGEVSIEDELIEIRGRRAFESVGCQQTAYYAMKEALSWLESEIKAGVEEASGKLPNVTRFWETLNRKLNQVMVSFRETYPGLELRLRCEKDFYLEGGELKALVRFTLTLKDPEGLFIKSGEERKGFWCVREVVVVAGR
ncbi:MAG: hypothetical protein QXO55_04740 [Candidatus Korarchaeum sp.]